MGDNSVLVHAMMVERWFVNWKYSCKFGGSWW